MTTITVTQDNKTLTISHPFDIVLTPDNEHWYSWRHVFATILFWLSWDKDAINLLMPDCEECDVVEELNREHNAELEERCNGCGYKREALLQRVQKPLVFSSNDGVNDGVNEGVRRCYTCQRNGEAEECYTCTPDYINWKPKESVQDNVHVNMEVNMDDAMEVKNCDNCENEDVIAEEQPCKDCFDNEEVDYANWKQKEPPIITEEVEKDTGKDCENCEYFDNKDFEHPCDVCVCFDGEGKAIVPTHWQPISVKTSNDETTIMEGFLE